MFSIGEFSKVSGLTVKTLRFYHEQGVLIPAFVDEQTGYRYYNSQQLEQARIITQLRKLEFTLQEIRDLLVNSGVETDLLDTLERQRTLLQRKARHYRAVVQSLDHLIRFEREARMRAESSSFQVEEKSLEPLLIAGVRMKGRYCDSGQGFARIGKSLGRQICGPCFLLHYDTEHKDDDADFEACMPIRKAVPVEGVDIRKLPGGHGVTLRHRGPYGELSRSYAAIFSYMKSKGYTAVTPTREVYLKGPGMILKGNPKNYLTEIQILIEK